MAWCIETVSHKLAAFYYCDYYLKYLAHCQCSVSITSHLNWETLLSSSSLTVNCIPFVVYLGSQSPPLFFLHICASAL